MKFFNKLIPIITMSILIIAIVGCNNQEESQVDQNNSKKQVIATLFPQYDFVKQIAKDNVEVTLLLPPGVESHSYEPTPRDIAKISTSDLFVYTGKYMEPWAQSIIDSMKENENKFVDTSKGIELLDLDDHDEDHHYEENHRDEENHNDEEDVHLDDEHSHEGKDPHIWLDPVFAQKMVDNILESLVKIDYENETFYRENAETYKKSLIELDIKNKDAFEKVTSKKIVYGGHFAFGYFAKRYGLTHVSPYEGFSPNAEPNPKKIVELIKTLNESGNDTIFYEENIDPKVARVISEETGAKMLLLHGVHNISKDDISSDKSYLKIMNDNLTNLKEGLGYVE